MDGERVVHEIVSTNVAEVRDRIRSACERSGRDVSSVEMIAVTKYAELDWIAPLPELGVTSFGESRPQQLVERAPLYPEVDWHLVGHLQRNKVRRTLPEARWIHSVDSLRLLEAIDRVAGEEKLQPRILLEVNVSGEASKDGFAPEEVRSEWSRIASCRDVTVGGLMTMPAHVDEEAEQRAAFRTLRELRDELRDRSHGELSLEELSMGTSHDFPAAILEGATMIRVGRTLFRGLRDA